tara:strand:- start:153 stop:1226 length:1074 start_codon:yes stop_codon:yes gene_type:complete
MLSFSKKFKIGNKYIGESFPTYFIADIASNHDQNLKRAKKLIYLAKKSGADAVKFQHFNADTLVSDIEFSKLKIKSHQSKWKDSTYNIYKKNELLFEWTSELYKYAKKNKIDFFTSAYSAELVDKVNKFIPAYKIGSGDITDHEIIKKIAKKHKPVFIATGAATENEVDLAVKILKKFNKNICLMQCNTNYTGSSKNLKYLNLKILTKYQNKYKILTGLSDHTQGDLSVIAAVAMGARVIEKHFTDNNSRIGPDHYFSMNPLTWKNMVKKVRNIESAFGNGKKKIEENEIETSILQRRSVMLNKDKKKGEIIKKNDFIFLRPNVDGGYQPYEYNKIVGRKLNKNKYKNHAILKKDLK